MKLFTRKNALLLTAVIILLAAACAFALSREQKPLFVSEPALAPSNERDFMSVSVEATGDLRTVKGSMCLTATNRTGEDLSEIVLRAYPNAIQQGSVTLYGATVNGESVPVGMDSGDPSVWRIQTPWRAGETLEISWQAALIVPRGESVIGRTDESALLIGALPLPAVWENGAWRTDEYDELAETSYGQAVDIQMALTVPKTVLAAFGGAWIDEQDNGDGTKTLAMQLSGAREIAFAMRAEGEIRQTRAGDVLITALAENSAHRVETAGSGGGRAGSHRKAGIQLSVFVADGGAGPNRARGRRAGVGACRRRCRREGRRAAGADDAALRAADLRRAGGKRSVERAVAERNARLLRGADGVSAERRRRGLRKAIL